MDNKVKCWIAVLVVAVLATWLRLGELRLRPMHTDEAVHAVKFGDLLEKGEYTYDYNEYHGPTLNYFTLIATALAGKTDYIALDEIDLRIVPAVFGLLVIIFYGFLARPLGMGIVILAAVVTAVSPAMAFYSRYYIQETLLVCFTFGLIISGYRYFQSKSAFWAASTGLFAGLAFATKETCVIAFGSIVLALALTRLLSGRNYRKARNSFKAAHLLIAIFVFIAVSILFYSSFFTNPHGVIDSVATFTTYLERAEGNNGHKYPWHYYLHTLLFYRDFSGRIWSEAYIVIFAGIGFFAAVFKKGLKDSDYKFIRFIAFYTLLMTVIYSAISYKTPWCMLGFLHGMIILAAVGMVVLARIFSGKWNRAIPATLITYGIAHLAYQAYLANYKYYSDPPGNPYVYAHTTTDVFHMAEQLEMLADVHPDGCEMAVEVICPGSDYWPLPWRLRKFTNVGYRSEVHDRIAQCGAIIASPQYETEIINRLYSLRPPGQQSLMVYLFDEDSCSLRPAVELYGLTTKDLLDKALLNRDKKNRKTE